MSSHHFVKEGQEPALFIMDDLSFQTAAPLLEWAPLVLTTDVVLDTVLSWGIKVDVVLCQEQQVEEMKKKLLSQAPVKILTYAAEEDPLVVGLHLLISNKQKDVYVLSRPSEQKFVTAENFGDRIEVVFLDEGFKWMEVPTGDFQKWVPIQTTFQLRKSYSDQVISTEGLIEENGNLRSIRDGVIRITSHSLFWVGEPL